ncbi:carboxymuconolactone decarboxylase family protein [Bordetella bronchialis]|uniref:Carboxymuconolactone decarboxylase n=1 Tax=Bordetella bronchialis TaxID=463025 RepID=A0A193FYI5_9BORD|nr:carboxymuconolactone decarboxylase family protein [Bordetella bronchialis]ANN72246.1 carboxymuconolactone decarboxylase [Bordetella bronchialis]
MSAARIDRDIARNAMGQPHESMRALGDSYRDLLGYLPPRVESRLLVTGALDPELVRLQEAVRAHAMNPKCFDTKTAQLMIFGMLVVELSDAAVIHGIAARRAGATWEEMQAVVSMAYIFRGVSAANRGAEMLARIAEREAAGGQ